MPAPITYFIAINVDGSGRPFVEQESLFQHPKKQTHGQSTAFLMLTDGKGVVWKGEGKKIEEDNEGFDHFKGFQMY